MSNHELNYLVNPKKFLSEKRIGLKNYYLRINAVDVLVLDEISTDLRVFDITIYLVSKALIINKYEEDLQKKRLQGKTSALELSRKFNIRQDRIKDALRKINDIGDIEFLTKIV